MGKVGKVLGEAGVEIVKILTKGWPVFVKQAKVAAISAAIQEIFIVAGVIISTVLCRYAVGKLIIGGASWALFLLIGFGTSGIILTCIGIVMIKSIVGGFMNPEYQAFNMMKDKIKDTIDSVKKDAE